LLTATLLTATLLTAAALLAPPYPLLSCSLGSFFAESGARPFWQMRNCSLSSCSFSRFLDVSLCSGSLSPGCHISW
jgi:hypothetical protein